MKLLATLLSIFVIASAVNGQEDYRGYASNLLNNVLTLINHVDEVDKVVTQKHETLSTTVHSIDFGSSISSNPLITELDQSLKDHSSCRNIHQCEELKDSTVQVVKKTLQQILSSTVEEQLYYYRTQLYYVKQTLLNISYDIQGRHLEKLIKSCTDSPRTCKITTDYPNEVTKDRQYVDTVGADTVTAFNRILENNIYPSINDKIRTVVYGPVNDCISHVSNS